MSDSVKHDFAPLDGMIIYGGCDHCEAYQEVKVRGSVITVNICHDSWCPRLRRLA
jgi:hypothetical protein